MKIKTNTSVIIFVTLFSFLISCNEKEEFTSEKLSEYIPLTVGKYITYRIDSTVYIDFDRVAVTRKYQVKHQVDALITDNMGRSSYRVYRLTRDSVNSSSWTPAQPWVNAGTYFITRLEDQVEVIEDNLRFIKLHMPIKNGFNWKGNKYLPNDPYNSLYSFNNDDNMENWDFYYDGEPSSFSYRNNNYTDVQTVEQADETLNIPVTLPKAYGSKSRSIEKYAKNIGLVYKQYILNEYQPDRNNPGGPNFAYIGFGITMWMIDHN